MSKTVALVTAGTLTLSGVGVAAAAETGALPGVTAEPSAEPSDSPSDAVSESPADDASNDTAAPSPSELPSVTATDASDDAAEAEGTDDADGQGRGRLVVKGVHVAELAAALGISPNALTTALVAAQADLREQWASVAAGDRRGSYANARAAREALLLSALADELGVTDADLTSAVSTAAAAAPSATHPRSPAPTSAQPGGRAKAPGQAKRATRPSKSGTAKGRKG